MAVFWMGTRRIPYLLGASLTAAGVTAALLAGPASGAVTPGKAPVPLPCTATMSNYHPADFTDVSVLVQTKPHVKATVWVHSKTTTRKHHRYANAKGLAVVPFYVGKSTPGNKIFVDVTVSNLKKQTGTCTTWFTPVK
jgi:hypothetical protein